MLPIGAMVKRARLEWPPFAPDQAHPAVFDRLAEDRAGEGDLAGRERTRGHAAEVASMRAFRATCSVKAHRYGNAKAKITEEASNERDCRSGEEDRRRTSGVEPDKVTEDASFIDDLGADSLDIVELVMAFEEEFGVEIPDDAAEKITTVNDAIEYIDQNKG